LGLASANARALARNIHHLLMDESHVHFAGDASAGSGAIEALTDALAERGWGEFQQLEREGGIVESLRGGLFQRRIAGSQASLASDFASGGQQLVGVTLYQLPEDAVSAGASVAAGRRPDALRPIRLEALAEGRAA
jgi:methylmalonyl-CoA mutase